jgi:hypothetical protein
MGWQRGVDEAWTRRARDEMRLRRIVRVQREVVERRGRVVCSVVGVGWDRRKGIGKRGRPTRIPRGGRGRGLVLERGFLSGHRRGPLGARRAGSSV